MCGHPIEGKICLASCCRALPHLHCDGSSTLRGGTVACPRPRLGVFERRRSNGPRQPRAASILGNSGRSDLQRVGRFTVVRRGGAASRRRHSGPRRPRRRDGRPTRRSRPETSRCGATAIASRTAASLVHRPPDASKTPDRFSSAGSTVRRRSYDSRPGQEATHVPPGVRVLVWPWSSDRTTLLLPFLRTFGGKVPCLSPSGPVVSSDAARAGPY